MTVDPEVKKKLQIFMVAAILIAAGRAGYVVYDRHQERKEAEQPKAAPALNPDVYVNPKKLHAHDVKSARDLAKQPVWVKIGYGNTYFPYDAARKKADFKHEAGTLGPLQKLDIKDVVTDKSPDDPSAKQVLATFQLDGKWYAVPIGIEKEGDTKIYADDMFFLEDPHDLYKHWPPDVWASIDKHEVRQGMSELQTDFAVGLGVPSSGAYGSRTLKYPNGGNPLVVTFNGDKATSISPGT